MKKINWNDVDVKTILEMHQKSGYKSSLLNEQIGGFTTQNVVNFAPNSGTKEKKQSNIVNTESYTLGTSYDLKNSKINGLSLRLNKNTKFVKSKKDPKYLITQVVDVDFMDGNSVDGTGTGVVYYGCYKGKFGINIKTGISEYGKNTWYDQGGNLVKTLKPICLAKVDKKEEVTPKQDKVTPKKNQGKQKTIKLNPTEEQQCQLLGDKDWLYAKKGNQWFASRDKTNWFDITNNKAAVDKLVAGCKNIKELVAFTPPPATEYEGPSPDEMKASQDGETFVSSTTGL